MQLAIDETAKVQKPSEGLKMKAEAGSAQHRSDDWARRCHQWQSRINQGSTQVNSTGVYRAMYWLYILYKGAHGPCYATVIVQWQKRSWVKGYQRRMAKGALIRRRKAEMKRK